jgi:hypothetical protein
MECPLKIPLSFTTNGTKIPHLKQCTASVNKASTSFYMVSTITHLTVPLKRQKCYSKCEGKKSVDFIVLEKKDYTTYSGEHFGKSYHTKVNTVYQ